jgi:hypothetical protein
LPRAWKATNVDATSRCNCPSAATFVLSGCKPCFGTESELAAAVVFLLSEASALINGMMIRVDGGVPNARHSWPLASAGVRWNSTDFRAIGRLRGCRT